MQQVSPSQFNDWLDQVSALGTPMVLDVRETWECEIASIAPVGFELLRMPMQTIPDQLMLLDKTRPIACLCHHGARSMQVASFLEHHGFEHIVNIAGGINAWSSQVDAQVPVY
jgi:hypothetical protein